MKAREHKEGCMTKLGGALMSAVLWTTIGPAGVSGVWTLDFDPDFGGNRRTDAGSCSFKQDGRKLSGDCGGGAITGEVRSQKVTFYVTTGKNNEYSATFTGKLDKQGRTIAGTWRLVDNLGKRSGKFTARKR
jgi:hypothetical protein